LKGIKLQITLCLYFQHKYAVKSRAQNTIHSAQSTIHSTQSTVNSERWKEHSAQYTVHSAQYTVHSAQSIAHRTQCTVHSAQYTVHSALEICYYSRPIHKNWNLKTNLHWCNFANFYSNRPHYHKLYFLPLHHFSGPNVNGATLATA